MKNIYLSFLMAFAFLSLSAQVNIYQESFESAPSGTTYSAATEFGGSDANDYWQRITITGNGKDEINTGVTGADGTYMYAGEDLDGSGPNPKVLTMEVVPVSSYGSLDVQLAVGSGTQNKYDSGDFIEVYVKKNGGAEELIGAFYGRDFSGNDNTNGRMYEDVNLSGGVADDSQVNQLSEAMFDVTYPISGSYTTLQVIVKMNANSGDEVLMVDNVRVRGVLSSSPTLSASTTTVTGLDYEFGNGPSTSTSVTVSGSNLIDTVFTTALTNFEISYDGTTWFSLPDTLQPILGSVPPTPILVRLKDGLPGGVYNETITVSSTGATSVTISLSGEVSVPCSELFISEYIETGNTKMLEIYNPTGAAVNLNTYDIKFYFNTTTSPGNTISLPSVMLASGEVYVVGYSNAGNTYSGDADLLNTGGWFNGNDAIELLNGTTVIDLMGIIGSGNITYGETKKLVRKSTVQNPNTTYDLSEWNDVSIDNNDLGFHTSDCITVSCDISDLAAGTNTACDPGTNTYTQNVIVTYSNAPATGMLDVNGQTFAIGTSPQTVTLTGLVSNGAAVNVTASFTDLGACNRTETNLFTAQSDCTPAATPCSQLFISEYGEPDGGSDKYVEIYNPTSGTVDLSNYRLWKISNGGSWPEQSISLSGSLTSGDVYVVASNNTFNGNVDLVNGTIPSFNGDDAVGLAYNGGSGSTFTLIDAIGEDGADPGAYWTAGSGTTEDHILIRKSTVQNPNDNWATAASEWDTYSYTGGQTITSIGYHTSDCITSTNQWEGFIDTDWSTPGNWSNGWVPLPNEEIIIPGAPLGGNFPLASVDVVVEDLTLEPGSAMDMAPGYGLSLAGTVTVFPAATLTLQSDASGTAWLDDFTNAGNTFTGNLTVQTYVTTGSGLGQRYFGSPVVSGTVSGLDGTYTGYPLGPIQPMATCDPNQLESTSPYSNLFQWNEDATFTFACVQFGWEAISAGTTLTSGRGYSGWVNDGSIISFTGTPNSGDVTFSTTGVTSGANTSASVAAANGWHLLSNPFPSPLDAASVFSSGFTSPQTYDGGSGPYSGTFNSVLISGDDLAVMQGFVAQSTSGTDFTASQSDRVAGNEVWLRPEFTHMLEIDILGSNNMGDRTYIYFDSETTDQFDAIGDCVKRESDFGHPTLFSQLDNKKMSVNGFFIDRMNNSVGVGLMPGTDATYTMTIEGINSFPATSLIFLEDKQLGTMTNLRENNVYQFVSTLNDDENRFEIHFTAPVEFETIASTCAAEDGELIVDFGINDVNGDDVYWNYTLTNNGSVIASGIDVQDLEQITSLNKGSYTLELNHNGYIVTETIEVDGADPVAADFEEPMLVEVGDLVELNNQSTGGLDFLWSVENESYTSIHFSHTFDMPGVYSITLDASNPDCAASIVKDIEVAAKTTAIKDTDEWDDAKVYSNGSTIVVDLTNVPVEDNMNVDVYNLLGQVIYSNEMNNEIHTIQTKYPSSYYLVVLSSNAKQKVFKVFIK